MNLHRSYLTNPRLTPPDRSDFGLDTDNIATKAEIEEIKAAIKKQVDLWSGAFPHGMSQTDILMIKEYFSQTLLEMSLADKNLYVLAEARLGIPSNIRDYLARERDYAKAYGEYKSYQRWLKERNPARAATEAVAGYDTKFAVHLVRLLACSVELLNTGHYNVCRKGIDADLLLDIRAGKLKYEDILAMADSLKQKAKEAFDKNPAKLPPKPQSELTNNLLFEIVSGHLGLSKD
jgi:hypothetical protein